MTEELLSEFAPEIESLTLIPSDGGRFEFVVNGDLVFSKKQLKRHAEPGEIRRLLKQYLKN